MRFSSLLKGRLAERILVTLLEQGGYRVTRLGIEELFDEVKYLGNLTTRDSAYQSRFARCPTYSWQIHV